jgi:hypothetical protein
MTYTWKKPLHLEPYHAVYCPQTRRELKIAGQASSKIANAVTPCVGRSFLAVASIRGSVIG